MPKYSDLNKKKDEEKTTIGVNCWFLRFLNNFRTGRESWQEIIMRLITAKRLSPEDSDKLKRETANYKK